MLNRILITLILYLGISLPINAADAPKTDFTFATIKTGQDILTANDNYFNRMSPAEIAIRSQSPKADKTASDLKAQYRDNILEWTDEEKTQIRLLLSQNKMRLNKISHLLPSEIILVKTSDKVEGGMPHTRANAIILPNMNGPLTEQLFYHELFHVLSRQQKSRHDSLYAIIGFLPCDLADSSEMAAINLTNPDVPAEAYYLPVTIDDQPAAIMPYLHAAYPAYNSEVKGGFGGHFGFGLLKVTINEGKCTVDKGPDHKLQIISPAVVPDFVTAIGQNTHYIIHAEEVLADNFSYAILEKEDLPNPEIITRLNEWLQDK